MSAKAKPDKQLAKVRERSLLDALAQERLALAAITKVLLLEVDDPQRVLVRLDAMARSATANRRVPAGTRRALIDGVRLVRRAIERERGEDPFAQPTLLDPPSPEPKPERVDELAAATDGPQQLGLVGNEQIGADLEAAHEERVATVARIHEAIIELLRAAGAANDDEIHHRYTLAAMHADTRLPQQTKTAIVERRRELVQAGRLKSAGDKRWDLVERELIGEATG